MLDQIQKDANNTLYSLFLNGDFFTQSASSHFGPRKRPFWC